MTYKTDPHNSSQGVVVSSGPSEKLVWEISHEKCAIRQIFQKVPELELEIANMTEHVFQISQRPPSPPLATVDNKNYSVSHPQYFLMIWLANSGPF